MSYVIQQVGGRVPTAQQFVDSQITAASFTATTNTITSLTLTGLSRTAAVSFGAYGYAQVRRAIAENAASFPYGGLTFLKTAWVPQGPHEGLRAAFVATSFQAPAYSITSLTLTGLSRTAAVSFGAYAAVKVEKDLRRPGVNGAFASAGALTVVFTARVPNQFIVAGSTTVAFAAPAVAVLVESDGSTVIVFTGAAGNQFRSNGSTTALFFGGVASRFEVDGRTVVVFYATAGQLESDVSGSGVLPAGSAPENAAY